jgi:hypothetical protein
MENLQCGCQACLLQVSFSSKIWISHGSAATQLPESLLKCTAVIKKLIKPAGGLTGRTSYYCQKGSVIDLEQKLMPWLPR